MNVAVKSIKVKLMLGHLPEIREGLWHLHEAVNLGVRYYTEWLALLRQGNLYRRGKDGAQECYMTAEQCRQELLVRLRDRQKRNGHTGDPGTDEELLGVARRLYELLVPQSVGKKGQAQMLASGFLSPLADPKSEGGKGTSKSGRKPAWMGMKEAGDSRWVEAKARYEANKAKDPTKQVIASLEMYGLRPLFDVFTETYKTIRWMPLGKHQGVRAWDRDMFQQSLERLMSWESWNERVGAEFARLVDRRDRFREKHFTGQEHLVALAQRLEQEMKEASPGFESKSSQAHRITKRALRGADGIIDDWLKLSEGEPVDRFDEILRKRQAQNPRRFGSHDLFLKLAEPVFQPLWREDPSFLSRWASYNEVLNKLEDAKQFATFTLPSPCSNPVWARFENAEGTNIFKYDFLFDHFGKGRHGVRFQRMIVMRDGVPTEVEGIVVPIAPSRQLDALAPNDAASPIDVFVGDPAAPGAFRGQFGGAKIQYRRSALVRKGRREEKAYLCGFRLPSQRRTGTPADDAGEVFLNLSLRVESQSEQAGRRNPPYAAVFHISDQTRRVIVRYGEIERYLAEHPDTGIPGSRGLTSGLRVMSVDLGLRTSAAISVFRVAHRDELTPDAHGRQPFFFPIHGMDHLVALHERSHLIRLPGETESKKVRSIREQRLDRLNRLRSQMASLRLLVRTGVLDEQKRDRNWERLQSSMERGGERMPSDWWDLFQAQVRYLAQHRDASGEAWGRMVQAAVRTLWRQLAKQVRDWRKEVRRNADKVKIRGIARDVPGGHSLAQLDYLERQYRFLRSWSAFSVQAGQVVRAERDSRFAVALREHIDNGKKDRLKKLADRILMEALGYVYVTDGRRAGQWQAVYPPCQLVLLEELSEYRFSNDRPPSENSQLMVWSHRGVLEELIHQAQVHDVLVGTIPAAFSSRFDARTGAPGIRCRRVPSIPLKDAPSIPIWLSHYLKQTERDAAALRPGELIPTGDGEFLVTPAGRGASGVRVVHADINAAHNLQRRLWENFDLSDIRVRCDRREGKDGTVVLIPRLTNQRVKERYSGVIFTSEDGVSFTVGDAKTRRRSSASQGEGDDLSDEEQELLAEADDARERSVVLFRDPSGFVNGGRWTAQRAFWGMVHNRIETLLAERFSVSGAAEKVRG